MTQSADILIIGGGVIGLAIALELRQRGSDVTVLTGDRQGAATRAAAGMLAPHAEQLPPGALLDLGLKSLSLYPDWIQRIEDLSGCKTGYWPSGILAPVYASPTAAAHQGTEQGAFSLSTTPSHSSSAQWLDSSAIHNTQPGLGPDIIGGWWYPDDGQVDNRQLFDALWQAAERLGITLRSDAMVEAMHHRQGRVAGVRTANDYYDADHYVVATGAWTANLLPVPIQPLKGQMLSVTVPADNAPGFQSQALKRVLYGQDVYIVPRKDGRILIGATVESVGFIPHNTPAGLHTLLDAALRLYPALTHYPINEYWWGFRPATPDEAPILGASYCDNLTLAAGHHRNGILLAPATALLVADWIWNRTSNALLDAFSWKRFNGLPASSNGTLVQASISNPSLSSDHLYASESMQPFSSSISLSVAQSGAVPPPEHQGDRPSPPVEHDVPLIIAGRTFQSRLMTGTGKYRTVDQMHRAIAASGCQIVTVAVRRVQTQAPGHEGLAEALDWSKLWMLPNTAGCKTAEEAIRVARLGREMAKLLGQEDNNFVKLEVIPDATYLLPDPIDTLNAAEQLVKEGFAVLPYINADPLLAKRLEEVGCATVMPLGSPIGSGQGIRNAANIQIIIENANVPVVVDAGIGTPSEAAQAMELGADALLINTAIAQATDPEKMGKAMGLATEAGRLAFLAGRIPIKQSASASSPLTGTISG